MTLDNAFLNLTAGEAADAQRWLGHLRDSEQERVRQTLDLLNPYEFEYPEPSSWREEISEGVFARGTDGEWVRRPYAVIVAGSSVDTDDYRDIDFFVVLEENLTYLPYKPHPVGRIKRLEGNLPEHVEVVFYNYGGPEPVDPEVNGAQVTISVLYELHGFDKRREGKTDDILEPRPLVGAEEFMEYNRDQGSKFLVLTRQYEAPE
ncbi:MAG: hypothetical protein QF824_05040 [Candidatus Woesearchaeota archaeon]|jgi:hypothetical protein|nr:hypothetical protein [Candidatus Woesearchaeota archaeon]MDP7180609.1 hypothetical protein [Candidatus Woesearchaeota archaeon]MDP7457876.1 hypothetical protein [Candidatus Woesearchaeota archaeon]